MPRFKIQPNAGETLCGRCREGIVYERSNGVREAFCHLMAHMVRVPLDIVRCSEFDAKDQPSEYEMQKIAWQIRHDRSGTIVGFKPPEKKDD